MNNNNPVAKWPAGSVPLTLGLDIGIASVGWAVLTPQHILDLGVRAFDKAETADRGESLNLTRRMARLTRRRLRRRAWRLTKLGRLLKREGLLADARFFHQQPSFTDSTWSLRVAGLNRLLNAEEWARVLYHLCKHRGFHWASKAEEQQAEGDTKGEGGRVKKGLKDTEARMKAKDYRTAAEMVLAEFPEAQRNKQGDYGKALARVLLGEELAKLFDRQRAFGNQHAHDALQTAILGKEGKRRDGLFWAQEPALAGADLLKMLGKCTFEKGEYRAPKASFTAERHVWLTRLNNLRVVVDGRTRGLSEDERRLAVLLPYQQASVLTYKQLGSALVKAGHLPAQGYRFTGLAYPSAAQMEEGKGKDPESATLVKLPAWHELRQALTKAGLADIWQRLSVDALDGKPESLDEIARVLSVFKDDDEVQTELRKLALPGGQPLIDALLAVRFDKFHALSLKALRAIVPHMETGLRYDEACQQAGYHHSQLHVVGAGTHRYLPPLYSGRDKDGRMVFDDKLDVPRNPVVLRALNQARKVVNAVIRRYGPLHAVHIEMARDLSRPMDERQKVKKAQDEFRERNQKAREDFEREYGHQPNGRVFEKWMLYREQQGKCAYSLEALDIALVLEDQSYAEIDHALPYSRSYDDSKNNKVLVLTKENRDKGNRTVYEYLTSFAGGEAGERWRSFAAWVDSNKSYRAAKRNRLLRKDFGKTQAEEFRERNLNDTRYICRFFKNYVEQHLRLADGSDQRRCVVLSGQMTAFMRARWGLTKIRSESDRHHALDAVVVAACSHGMVKRLADYSRTKELAQVREGFVDPDTGEIINPAMHAQLRAQFPDPWQSFRNELEARLRIDDPATLRAEVERLGSYSPEAKALVRPLFVSRAPQRRNAGAAHKETIYAKAPTNAKPLRVTQKVALSSLSLKDLDNLVEPHRNERLYAAIRARLEAHGGKADKAFPADNPLRKPDRNGEPTGPIVRTVTVAIDKMSGIPVRSGVAKNDSMLRVDVFSKAGKFHLVPVYVHHRVNGLPNRAIVAFKDEDEWTQIDESFEFCFSLHPNDLVKVTLKKEQITGYYAGCDRSTGAVSLWAHDRSQAIGKDGMMRGIGVKLAQDVAKFHVDLLGSVYPAPPEPRRGLA